MKDKHKKLCWKTSVESVIGGCFSRSSDWNNKFRKQKKSLKKSSRAECVGNNHDADGKDIGNNNRGH